MKGSLVLTTMRNEGPFILEWVAWQKILGFEKILILFNDCTDHSPSLLRQLKRLGEISAKRHKPPKDEAPQPWAYEVARNLPETRKADWLFCCDVDEFLVIHRGDGTLSDLLTAVPQDHAGMVVNWRIFGSDKQIMWHDTLVHRRFHKCADEATQQSRFVKTILHKPHRFGRWRAHTPRYWQGEGAWGQGDNRLVQTDGSDWTAFHPDNNVINQVTQDQVRFSEASLHHYMLQSIEQFEHKRGTLSASRRTDRYDDTFFTRFNHNHTSCTDVAKYQARFDAEFARLCALPDVMRLHHLCCADFVRALADKRGDGFWEDPRYIHHMQMADAIPAASKPARGKA